MNPILRYHARSKHHLDRYAAGPGGLDWATQPDPFRRYEAAPIVELPLIGAGSSSGELPPTWDDLFSGRLPPQPMNAGTIAGLLELSFGLSAWKSYGGNRWALRCNPSMGNLHPTEAWLLSPSLDGLPAGLAHYRPDEHALELRLAAPCSWSGGFFIALSGIAWREAWKYGLRAFRYCQHDCGHALGAVAYAAAIHGWPARRLDEWSDDAIAAACGLDRTADFPADEPETAEAMLWIGHGTPPSPATVLAGLAGGRWSGIANRLSPQHRDWPDIPEILAATAQAPGDETAAAIASAPAAGHRADVAPASPSATTRPMLPPNLRPNLPPISATPASRLIRQRRSAQAFDGVTQMTSAHFFRMLDALLPRPDLPPWSVWPDAPAVHPIFFVHRVEGLAPGIYALPRDAAGEATLRAALGDAETAWLWERVPAAPAHLPVHLLAPLDVRAFAATSSCHQDIASDSAFMVAMLARFDDLQGEDGPPERPWLYRRRFHEAGLLGQALYLEAEAGGLQGTGIGCYFDDVVHRALRVDTTRFQDVYHFTVGGALVDERLGTESGYGHLAGRPGTRPAAEC
jgi:SagB-type dehydrogenase family enzyme